MDTAEIQLGQEAGILTRVAAEVAIGSSLDGCSVISGGVIGSPSLLSGHLPDSDEDFRSMQEGRKRPSGNGRGSGKRLKGLNRKI
ncbi:hypothetical protein VZT92_019714 [Zoarces viviparus]